MTTINIAKIEAVSLEEVIAITIDFNNELYNFQALVYDSPKHKFLKDLSYLDKYSKPLSVLEKKAIRKYLEEYFKTEGQ